MLSWYYFAVAALVFLGCQRFLYKVAAEWGCDTAWTTFSFMGTVTVLSVVLFFLKREAIDDLSFLVIIAFINSLSFIAATICTMEALKHLAASVVYPIGRLNIFVVVLFSLFYFHDRLSIYEMCGIILSIFVVVMLARFEATDSESGSSNKKLGFLLVLIALVAGAVASVSSKFAALHTNLLAFMALSYGMGTGFSLGVRTFRKGENRQTKKSLLIGLCMGVMNFVGFYCFLIALETGPLSLVVSITGLYFVFAIVLSVLFYHERLSAIRIAGIVLTIAAVMLLRL